MQKKSLAAMTAVGLAAAIAIPTIAFGNARRDTGSLMFLKDGETPFVAQLSGAKETPAADPDGAGAVAFTFDIINSNVANTGAEACWDMSYTGLTGTPTAAHIHRGAAGVNGPIVVPAAGSLPNLTATGTSGCIFMDPTLATEIMTTPSNFYVNVHTTDFPNGAIRGQLSAGPPPAGEAHLLAVPLRAYDSRVGGGPKIAPLETRTISLASGKDITGASSIAVPPGATAAIVTLTVTETVGVGGFLKLYNAAITEPATSSINWAGANQNIAVTTQVAVDALGQVKVTGGANATHFVIDVIGYLF